MKLPKFILRAKKFPKTANRNMFSVLQACVASYGLEALCAFFLIFTLALRSLNS